MGSMRFSGGHFDNIVLLYLHFLNRQSTLTRLDCRPFRRKPERFADITGVRVEESGPHTVTDQKKKWVASTEYNQEHREHSLDIVHGAFEVLQQCRSNTENPPGGSLIPRWSDCQSKPLSTSLSEAQDGARSIGKAEAYFPKPDRGNLRVRKEVCGEASNPLSLF